jgi:hypothetical protein
MAYRARGRLLRTPETWAKTHALVRRSFDQKESVGDAVRAMLTNGFKWW